VVLRTAPDSCKDYVSIRDVTRALVRIATAGRERLYNVASGRNTTHAEVASALRACTGCAVEFAAGAPTVAFPPIDVGRLRAEFPFEPASVLDELPDLVRAYADNPGRWS
jgi:nucleoside-diphosphate-sugar epimerase